MWRRMAPVSSVLVHQNLCGPRAVCDLWEEGESAHATAVIAGVVVERDGGVSDMVLVWVRRALKVAWRVFVWVTRGEH